MSDKEFTEVNPEEGDEIVELIDDTGRTLRFYHLATMPYKEQWFVFFQPAEEMEGTSEEEVVIFRISDSEDEKDTLLPVEDEALLEEVYEEFCRVMEEEEAAEEAEELEGCNCGCDGDGHGCRCKH